MEADPPPGWKTPRALLEMPELSMWGSYYFNAFGMLSSSRNSGMSVGAIPLSELTSYCAFFDVDEPMDFIQIIQRVDAIYLGIYQKKQEQASKKKKGKR